MRIEVDGLEVDGLDGSTNLAVLPTLDLNE
jgi:hypothetical protein